MRAVLPRVVLAFVLGALARPAGAQPLFTSAFPPEEFAARRTRVMAAIGDGVAVLQGATELPSYLAFRQSNHVFYLTGVEVPRAIVLIDGRTRRTTLFLPPRDERMERSEGPILVPGDEAVRLTGIEAVVPRDEFAAALDAVTRDGRPIYTPHRGESLGAFTPSAVDRHQRLSSADPWDGRMSREAAFIARIKARAPQVRVEDLDPILDRMRLVKSRREIEAIREATRISSAGILEAMKAARPGTEGARAGGRRRLRVPQERGAGRRLLRARRHREERPLPALSRRRVGAAGRRSRALRLCARRRQLHLGRHAHVPGQRPLHAVAARDLHGLPALLPRADGGAEAGPDGAPGPRRGVREDGPDRRRHDLHRSQDRRGRRAASSPCSGRNAAPSASATGSAWKCTTSTPTPKATSSSPAWSSRSSRR